MYHNIFKSLQKLQTNINLDKPKKTFHTTEIIIVIQLNLFFTKPKHKTAQNNTHIKLQSLLILPL